MQRNIMPLLLINKHLLGDFNDSSDFNSGQENLTPFYNFLNSSREVAIKKFNKCVHILLFLFHAKIHEYTGSY